MDAQTQILFCLMLLDNSFHETKLLRSGKTKHKQRKGLPGHDRGFEEQTH